MQKAAVKRAMKLDSPSCRGHRRSVALVTPMHMCKSIARTGIQNLSSKPPRFLKRLAACKRERNWKRGPSAARPPCMWRRLSGIR